MNGDDDSSTNERPTGFELTTPYLFELKTAMANSMLPGPLGIKKARHSLVKNLEHVLDSAVKKAEEMVDSLSHIFSHPNKHHKVTKPPKKKPLLPAKPLLLFSRIEFFKHYKKKFGPIKKVKNVSGKQVVANLEQLLTFMENDPRIRHVTWVAYILATVRTECGRDYMPRIEDGCRDNQTPVCLPLKDKKGKIKNHRHYGDKKDCPNLKLKPTKPCPAGKQFHTYYGRGYVQLTLEANYVEASQFFGVDLIHFPEKALEPALSYKIMARGLLTGKGFANGHKLSDFMVEVGKDKMNYVDARKMVNAADKQGGKIIAGDAEKFEKILRASLK